MKLIWIKNNYSSYTDITNYFSIVMVYNIWQLTYYYNHDTRIDIPCKTLKHAKKVAELIRWG